MFLQALNVPKPRRQGAAFTLPEAIIAVALTALLVTILVPFSVYTATALANLANFADLNGASVTAVDRLTSDIRCASEIKDFATNKLELKYATNGAPIRYEYDPAKGVLTRQFKGKPEVLMSGCKQLQFSVYQRYLAPGEYDQYPVANTNSDVKVVAISWAASRSLLGARSTQDELQSAKVILRSR